MQSNGTCRDHLQPVWNGKRVQGKQIVTQGSVAVSAGRVEASMSAITMRSITATERPCVGATPVTFGSTRPGSDGGDGWPVSTGAGPEPGRIGVMEGRHASVLAMRLSWKADPMSCRTCRRRARLARRAAARSGNRRELRCRNARSHRAPPRHEQLSRDRIRCAVPATVCPWLGQPGNIDYQRDGC
jgi:hypothetical protein